LRSESVLHILEKHKSSIKISFGEFLDMLPFMRIRQYSISSSPLWNPEQVILTVSVIESPSLSEDTEMAFLGVASNYLAQLNSGDRVLISIRPSATAFAPPQDPSIPMVMFCAGSGLAPMRGEAGRDVGKIVLFYGCRSPDMDYLYSTTDLADADKLGNLEVRPAFSRASEKSEGCKYVQE
jgi:cytochrome P450 / NADPH-cytochrome P450 reductase